MRTVAGQDGVISRRQVLALGGTDDDIETALRRRRWARVHPGVYVDHTGAPTWRQRTWAAVLLHAPAALTGRSALAAAGLRPPSPAEPIELLVDAGRRVTDPPGVRTTRSRAFDDVVMGHLSPPRVRTEVAVPSVASTARSEDAAVAVLADACQQRHTTPARLAEALTAMTRLPRRRLLAEVLRDVAEGAYSALERRYLRDVERAHGLPRARRQRREVVEEGSRVVYRDAEYVDERVLVELDGRLGHEWASDRWADLGRDVVAARNGRLTLRAGWGQALAPCRTASAIAAVLRSRGWRGEPQRCGPDCRLSVADATGCADRGGSPAPGAGDPPRSVA